MLLNLTLQTFTTSDDCCTVFSTSVLLLIPQNLAPCSNFYLLFIRHLLIVQLQCLNIININITSLINNPFSWHPLFAVFWAFSYHFWRSIDWEYWHSDTPKIIEKPSIQLWRPGFFEDKITGNEGKLRIIFTFIHRIVSGLSIMISQT